MHPDILRGAAHFARLAGKPIPEFAEGDIAAVTRAHADEAFEAEAEKLKMRNDISAGARHFARSVTHRDQVRGKGARPATSTLPETAPAAAAAPKLPGAKPGEIRMFCGKPLQWNGTDWQVPGRAPRR